MSFDLIIGEADMKSGLATVAVHEVSRALPMNTLIEIFKLDGVPLECMTAWVVETTKISIKHKTTTIIS